jgi:hypothetical protein
MQVPKHSVTIYNLPTINTLYATSITLSDGSGGVMQIIVLLSGTEVITHSLFWSLINTNKVSDLFEKP